MVREGLADLNLAELTRTLTDHIYCVYGVIWGSFLFGYVRSYSLIVFDFG